MSILLRIFEQNILKNLTQWSILIKLICFNIEIWYGREINGLIHFI